MVGTQVVFWDLVPNIAIINVCCKRVDKDGHTPLLAPCVDRYEPQGYTGSSGGKKGGMTVPVRRPEGHPRNQGAGRDPVPIGALSQQDKRKSGAPGYAVPLERRPNKASWKGTQRAP